MVSSTAKTTPVVKAVVNHFTTIAPVIVPVKGKVGPSYPALPASTFGEGHPKAAFGYTLNQADEKEFFQMGIAPLLIFCCAIFSVCWGTFAGLMVKKS